MSRRIFSKSDGKEKNRQQNNAKGNQPTESSSKRKQRKGSNPEKRRSIFLKTTKSRRTSSVDAFDDIQRRRESYQFLMRNKSLY